MKREFDFWAWFDQTVKEVRPSIAKKMTNAYFQPLHSGGGCMLWERLLDGGGNLWISNDGNSLDDDPKAAIWTIGRYPDMSEDSTHSGWYCVGACTLAQAVKIADTLPAPGNLEVIVTYREHLNSIAKTARDFAVDDAMLAAFTRLGNAAREIDDTDWGSDRQTEAQNVFFDRVKGVLPRNQFAALEMYCLKATTDEMIDEAMRALATLYNHERE